MKSTGVEHGGRRPPPSRRRSPCEPSRSRSSESFAGTGARWRCCSCCRSCSSSCSATRRASTSRTCPPSSSAPGAQSAAGVLPATFDVVATDAGGDGAAAQDELRRGEAVVAVVTPAADGGTATVLIDGTELFAAQAALRSLAELKASGASGAASGGQSPLAGASIPIRPGLRALQPGPAHGRHHDPGPLRHHPRVRRHRGDRARRRARAAERHHGAARGDAVPAARRVPRQDRALPAHRGARHGHRRGGRHAAVRRPLPRLSGHLRARRAAVPVRHAGHRRAHLQRLPDPGTGASSWR